MTPMKCSSKLYTGLFSPRDFFRPSTLVWGWEWVGCWFMNKTEPF